jgi:hypothetical protein
VQVHYRPSLLSSPPRANSLWKPLPPAHPWLNNTRREHAHAQAHIPISAPDFLRKKLAVGVGGCRRELETPGQNLALKEEQWNCCCCHSKIHVIGTITVWHGNQLLCALLVYNEWHFGRFGGDPKEVKEIGSARSCPAPSSVSRKLSCTSPNRMTSAPLLRHNSFGYSTSICLFSP